MCSSDLSAIRMNVASPLAENDDFARRSKLVVMFQKRGHPRLYEHKDMLLGTLDLLHVYVKHDVELMEEIAAPESDGALDVIGIKCEHALDCVKFCPSGAAAGAFNTAAFEFSGCCRGALRRDRL